MESPPPQDDSQTSQDSAMTATPSRRREVLYLAYGSNMSTAQMRQRCPHSTPIGLGELRGWTWVINARGYANVVAASDRDAVVYGLLYLLPPGDEARLDECEGVPDDYQKRVCAATWVRDEHLRPAHRELSVLVYVDGARVDEGRPLDEYVGRMETAIRDVVDNWGLDEAYADAVMRRFWAPAHG